MSSFAGLAVVVLCGILAAVNAHPVPTFYMTFTDANGTILSDQYNGMKMQTGSPQRIYWIFQDIHNNLYVPTMSDLMQMHDRWIHVLIVSENQRWTGHIHPDDFMGAVLNPTTNPNLSVFYVDTTFPAAGSYSIGANFLYNDKFNHTWRDGFAQSEFMVSGTPMMDPLEADIPRNYSTLNRFRTWNFTYTNNETFNGWIDTNMNYDLNNGYYAELQIAVNGTLRTVANTNITGATCTYFIVNLYNKTNGQPANMIPLMSAAVHFTVVNYDGAVYHAHGMALDRTMTFPQALTALGQVSMMELMKPNAMMNDPMFNMSMNADMIGITPTGQINCFADEGMSMYEMSQMGMSMDMNMWYGKPTFSLVSSIFHWPNPGNWRVYAWMKMLDENNNEMLYVPHFDISVDNIPAPPQTSETAAADNASPAIVASTLLMGLAALVL